MAKKNSDARARFAQRLRAIRIPRGYKTARSFAEALEIDENRYTRYERAEVEPDLQLLMKICSLLSATPNDLLCDTIGAPPIEFAMTHGFSERSSAGYQAAVVAPSLVPPPAQFAAGSGNALEGVRKAIGFQLAEVIATVESRAGGIDPDSLQPLDKLRRTVPIAARIEADAFQFIADIPERLKGIAVPQNEQEKLERLIQELIVAHKPGANDNT